MNTKETQRMERAVCDGYRDGNDTEMTPEWYESWLAVYNAGTAVEPGYWAYAAGVCIAWIEDREAKP